VATEEKKRIRIADKYRCMMISSVSKAIGELQFGRQINGKFQTDLLKERRKTVQSS
jgi:hypothetical protein